MTGQTVSTAVARQQKSDQLVGWLRKQQDDIAMAAASHIKPSAIVRVTQGALRRNEKLALAAIANPQSLLYALLDCARLGHEPDTDDYYLVPFGNEVTGIEGYKGIIERMYRAGGVSSVIAEVVRQKDVYAPQGSTTPPIHEFDDFAPAAERGPLRGAYAYAILPDGRCSYVVRMGRAEIMEHKAKSRGADKPDSPWQQWEPAMWKKTVLRGLEPYVPTSTEYRTTSNIARPDVPAHVAAAGSGYQPAAGNGGTPAPDHDIVDAELVDEPQNVPPGPVASGSSDAPPASVADPATSVSPAGPAGTSAKPTPQARKLDDLTKTVMDGWTDADAKAVLSWLAGAEWEGTAQQAKLVVPVLADELDAAEGVGSMAGSRLWSKYEKAKAEASHG